MEELYLAFDLGAESGRGVIGRYDGSNIALEELGRFPTSRGDLDRDSAGVRRWDFPRIVDCISTIVDQAETKYGDRLAGIGFDTWGVDFGLIDSDGRLIEMPVAYRDESHVAAKESVVNKLTLERLWSDTGIQPLPFNTLFQLQAIKERNPAILDAAKQLLFMPDLLANSIAKYPIRDNEYTIASTSQMLRAGSDHWDLPILEAAGIPTHFLNRVIQPGTERGQTLRGTKIYSAPGHDTAAAVVAIPADGRSDWAFLSSGTWSLMGVECDQPELDKRARQMRLSNEGGASGKTRLLKNIMGLWLVQECRRSLLKQGYEYSYEELTVMAADSPSGGPMFDAVDERFLAPQDMPTEIISACRESGQEVPNSVGSLIRCCLDSLAAAYQRTLTDLDELRGTRIETLHIVGGGTKNLLLNQLTADRCRVRVVAGPEEGTAAGNILAQLIGAGRLSNWEEARSLSANSFQPKVFEPNLASV